MSLRQSLFSVAPATRPAGPLERKPGDTVMGPPRPARLWPARRPTLPQPAFLTAWRGRAKQAKHGLYARSVRRGCERVAPPETAARTAGARRQVTAPLSTIVRHCSLLFAIVRGKNMPCSQFPRVVRLSRSASRRAPFDAKAHPSSVAFDGGDCRLALTGISADRISHESTVVKRIARISTPSTLMPRKRPRSGNRPDVLLGGEIAAGLSR